MAIKYQFTGGEALQRQIELLKYYPEIATKYFRPAMEQVVSGVKERIRANVPIKTGFASATLMSKVVGKGMNITGYVGWGGAGIAIQDAQGLTRKTTAWYMNIVEYGAPPHEIKARKAKILGLGFGSEFVTVFGSKVNHPGFSGRFILQTAFDASGADIETIFGAAAGQVVEELAQP